MLGFCAGLGLCDIRQAELLYSGDVGEMQQLFEVGDGVFTGVTRVLVPRVCQGLTLEDQVVVCLLRPRAKGTSLREGVEPLPQVLLKETMTRDYL